MINGPYQVWGIFPFLRDGKVVRYWDLAATEPKEGTDPDYSASAKILQKDGQYWILDVRTLAKC
jgi:phage terminase large subunit-like protein